MVIQKYVYLTVSQTPVFPLKPQKEVYFFLDHPVYNCEYLNEKETKIEFERIFEWNLFEQIRDFRKFEKNLKKRNEENSKKNEIQYDPFCDLLNSGMFSIG